MKVRFFIIIVAVFFMPLSCIHAQEFEQNDEVPQNRIIVGGGLGLQFGSVTLIDVSPIVGYKVSKRFVPGVGITYQYYKDTRFGYNYETSIYGGSVFARYYIWQDLFAHAEYQVLSYEKLNVNFEKERISVPGVLVGGGYRQWIGGSFAATIMVLFNLNETIDSPYENPIFRIGFQAGL